MTNFFKTSLAAVALAAGFASLPAVANDTIEHTIHLSATVPTESFYVLPKETGWIGVVQKLEYNPATEKLSSLEKTFTAINTTGAITGKVAVAPTMTSQGDDSFPLKVEFGKTELTTDPQEVLSAAEALAGKDMVLAISAVQPDAGYVPGVYSGSVQLEFDAVLPVTPEP